jgi:hypothetical protein
VCPRDVEESLLSLIINFYFLITLPYDPVKHSNESKFFPDVFIFYFMVFESV